MAHVLLEQTFFSLPLVTRTYLVACTLTSFVVELGLVNPFALYFNPSLIWRGQIWRLFTAFTYFGPLGFNFLFNMLFIVRYCRMLEEGSFLGRTADFVWMLIFGAVLTAFADLFLHLLFLGQTFTTVLVYVWARRNPQFRLNLFGLMVFQASYLPLVLFSFALVMDNGWIIDLVGIIIGHTYYFLEDVYPRQPNGFKVIRTPKWLKHLFDEADDDAGEEIPLDEFLRTQRPQQDGHDQM